MRRMEAPARIVKTALDTAFWLGIGAAALLIGWLSVSPWVLAATDGTGDVAIPVAIGSGSILPVLELVASAPGSDAAPPSLTHPRLVKGRGELRLDTRHWGWHILTSLARLLGVGVGLWIIFLLRRVMTTVVAGEPFAPSNSRNVRLIGLILVAAGIVLPMVEWATARYILARVAIENIDLAPPAGFRVDPVLGGLLVLVLATIFDRGSRLERDQSLTI